MHPQRQSLWLTQRRAPTVAVAVSAKEHVGREEGALEGSIGGFVWSGRVSGIVK